MQNETTHFWSDFPRLAATLIVMILGDASFPGEALDHETHCLEAGPFLFHILHSSTLDYSPDREPFAAKHHYFLLVVEV